MGRKRKVQELTVAQKFYIEQNYDKSSVSELVEATGAPQDQVEKIVSALIQAASEPAPVPEDAGFAVKRGANSPVASVVMTQSASLLGDDFRQGKIPPRQKRGVPERRQPSVHKMDPNKPSY